jgi:hypothetical protein
LGLFRGRARAAISGQAARDIAQDLIRRTSYNGS